MTCLWSVLPSLSSKRNPELMLLPSDEAWGYVTSGGTSLPYLPQMGSPSAAKSLDDTS